MVGLAQTDESAFAIGTHRQADGGDVLVACALDLELDRFDHRLRAGVDHADAGSQLVTHPQLAAIGCEGKAARALADLDVFHHLLAGSIHHMHQAGDLGGDIHRFAIRRHQHALGLLTHLDGTHALAAGHVHDADFGVFLVADVKRFTVRRQVEDFRVIPQRQLAHGLARGHVDQVGLLRVPTGHHQLFGVGGQAHVARALAGGHGAGHGEGLHVDQGQRVILFAADPGDALGLCGASQTQRERQGRERGERAGKNRHVFCLQG